MVTPITQLISRGLRKAPVKKMRARWTTIDPMNTMAAQWWTWRMTSPARTWNEMLSVDWYASDMCTPRNGAYEPVYTTSLTLGTKKKVRYTPVTSSTRNEYRAISPSMNDQWSGKILSSVVRTKCDACSRSSNHCPS